MMMTTASTTTVTGDLAVVSRIKETIVGHLQPLDWG